MLAPSSMSLTQFCCCIKENIPGGFSIEKIPGWRLKLCLLCRCLICHTAVWLVWFIVILMIIFHPRNPTFAVTNATLTQFNFNITGNFSATLHYNLAFNITIRNSNQRVGIYYRCIKVSASYRNKEFGFVTLAGPAPLYQGHKNTTFLPQAILQGEKQLVKFGRKDVSYFNKETAAGFYSVKVRVTFRVKVRYGRINAGFARFATPGSLYIKQIDCKLKIPPSVTNQTSGSPFKVTSCTDVGIYAN